MKLKWKKLLTRMTLWLLVEVSLNLLGLDDLADYSEFIFERNLALPTSQIACILSQLPSVGMATVARLDGLFIHYPQTNTVQISLV